MFNRKYNQYFAIGILILSILACASPAGGGTPRATPTLKVRVKPTIVPPTATQSVLVFPTDLIVPTAGIQVTPTSPAITITVKGGNINLRRGPSVAYNIIGILYDGQTATATGRSEDGGWLYVSSSGSLPGWVSAQTAYSTVSGEAGLLGVIDVPAAEPAFVRNCTFHAMSVKPGDFILPGRDTESNRLQFIPGEYFFYDTLVPSKNPVITIMVTEGDYIDITKDGLGDKSKCP